MISEGIRDLSEKNLRLEDFDHCAYLIAYFLMTWVYFLPNSLGPDNTFTYFNPFIEWDVSRDQRIKFAIYSILDTRYIGIFDIYVAMLCICRNSNITEGWGRKVGDEDGREWWILRHTLLFALGLISCKLHAKMSISRNTNIGFCNLWMFFVIVGSTTKPQNICIQLLLQ